ncbi:MAG TPA: class I SAM-dependent methyltransferase [Rhizomicrobium sp.]
MDERKRTVRDAYDAIAARYLDWSGGSQVRAHYLARLLALLPADAAVLELGCGAGVPVTAALAARARVMAADISPAQVALARANVPGATILCADMMALDFAAAAFDAVCAFYAITHLPREEHGEMFARVARWLKPGGVFFASLGAGETDGRTQDWLGEPNYFSHPAAETSLRLLADAGFAVEMHELAAQDLPGEEGLPFLWVAARKAL